MRPNCIMQSKAYGEWFDRLNVSFHLVFAFTWYKIKHQVNGQHKASLQMLSEAYNASNCSAN